MEIECGKAARNGPFPIEHPKTPVIDKHVPRSEVAVFRDDGHVVEGGKDALALLPLPLIQFRTVGPSETGNDRICQLRPQCVGRCPWLQTRQSEGPLGDHVCVPGEVLAPQLTVQGSALKGGLHDASDVYEVFDGNDTWDAR